MNKSDVVDVLSIVAAGDRRTIGDADVEMWHLVMGDVPKDFALNAVIAHRREHPGVWLEPGHIVERWTAHRRDRVQRAEHPLAIDAAAANNGDGIERRTLANGDEQFRFYTDDTAGRWRSTRGEAHQDAHNWHTRRNVTNVT